MVVALDVVEMVLADVDVVDVVGRCLLAGRVEVHDRLSEFAVCIPCCQEDLTNL